MEKITAAGPDGGYGDAEPIAAGGLRWPEKDNYDYTCHRTKAVKMRRTYYRKGKKNRDAEDTGDRGRQLFESRCAGDMAIYPNCCGHEGKLSSYIDGCDACGQSFWSVIPRQGIRILTGRDARQKSISNFIKAGVTVGIVAVALALLRRLCGRHSCFYCWHREKMVITREAAMMLYRICFDVYRFFVFNAVKALGNMAMLVSDLPQCFSVLCFYGDHIRSWQIVRNGETQSQEFRTESKVKR